MKFYIYLIDLLDSGTFKFIIKFRYDNSLNICFIDTKRCLSKRHDLLVSLNQIDFLPNTFKLFNFNKSRPYIINIIKEKELDFEIKFKKPDEEIIGNSIADFYSDCKFSDEMDKIFCSNIWFNRMDEIIKITLEDERFWNS